MKSKYKNYELIINQKAKIQKESSIINIITKIIFYFVIIFLYTIFIIFIVSKRNKAKKAQTSNISEIELLKMMTNNNKTLYEGAEICLEKNPDEELCFYQFLCPKEVIGKTRILMGNNSDGSYVMLNDFENIKFAYSIGIRDAIQFDKALADKGIDIYMYDHTINNLAYENEKFHWKKIGIGGISQRSNNIQTLEEMMKENGHLNEKNMILKMDVEGAEWDTLNDITEEILKQFKYLLIEFHFSKSNNRVIYNILKKIFKIFQPFYVHCSPFSRFRTFGNNKICSAIEVSYITRSGYSFTKDKSIYPIPEFSYGFKEGFNMNILKLFNNY